MHLAFMKMRIVPLNKLMTKRIEGSNINTTVTSPQRLNISDTPMFFKKKRKRFVSSNEFVSGK